jgi:hypothetical protein
MEKPGYTTWFRFKNFIDVHFILEKSIALCVMLFYL